MWYEPTVSGDLEETLRQYQKQAPGQAEFDFDLLKFTWHDVVRELEKAQAAVSARRWWEENPSTRVADARKWAISWLPGWRLFQTNCTSYTGAY